MADHEPPLATYMVGASTRYARAGGSVLQDRVTTGPFYRPVIFALIVV